MKTKQTGVIIIGMSLLFLFITLSFTNEINKDRVSGCACAPGVCPMANPFPIQTYIGIISSLILGSMGAYITIIAKKREKIDIKKNKKLKENLKLLNEDEKSIYEMVSEQGGALFQSELVEKTKLSKVKVSRILDKLEGKGLVERRRRGMTNLVLLKHDRK